MTMKSSTTWTELEAQVEAPVLRNIFPWREIYERKDFDGTYENGWQFLNNWGIGVAPMQFREQFMAKHVPSSFFDKWEAILTPVLATRPKNISDKLVEFFTSLDAPTQALLPSDFPSKASLVYDALYQFDKRDTEWSAVDLETKVHSIWHQFFRDFSQTPTHSHHRPTEVHIYSDKEMTQVPKGDEIHLYPNLIVENQTGVPCIIVENGDEEAVFTEHKNSFKVLAEGRLADTYTLSHFETNTAQCFAVVNGGHTMSIVELSSTLTIEQLPDGSSKSSRSYSASFISDNEVTEGGVTVTYDLANYSAIIGLFVALFIASAKMNYNRRDKPLTFTHPEVAQSVKSKTKVDQHTPNKNTNQQSRGNNNAPKTDKKKTAASEPQQRTPFPESSKLKLKRCYLAVEVREVHRNIRRMTYDLCGKVLPISKVGEIPTEFALQMQLDHPHILKIEELVYDEYNNYCMSVTPWIKYAIEMRRSAKENAMIAKGVLEALVYLHDNGIVHADVKVDNVVAKIKERSPESQVTLMHAYLIDFGVSFYARAPPKEIRGTFPYIAPEVVQNKCCSAAMDVWGFGLLLVELFCGFFASLAREVDVKQVARDWYNSRQYKFKLVEVLFDLVWMCLEEDPQKRITAKQALQHPFWAEVANSDPFDPVVRFILGNEFNLELPYDWAAVAEKEKGQITAP